MSTPRSWPTARARTPSEVSIDDLCSALYASAQNNDLPVHVLRQSDLAREPAARRRCQQKGRAGHRTIHAEDRASKKVSTIRSIRMQALPASARFLRELRMQFGNLGFVAAAYNAGPRRVTDWLQRRSACRAKRATMSCVSPDFRSTPGAICRSRAMRADFRRPPALPQPAGLRQCGADAGGRGASDAGQDRTGQARRAVADDLPQDDDAPLAKGSGKSRVRASKRQAHRKGNDRKESHAARRSGHEHHAAKREAGTQAA